MENQETWFDYQLQVWVRDGVVLPCAHPSDMRRTGPCCSALKYAGRTLTVKDGVIVMEGA